MGFVLVRFHDLPGTVLLVVIQSPPTGLSCELPWHTPKQWPYGGPTVVLARRDWFLGEERQPISPIRIHAEHDTTTTTSILTGLSLVL